jgi:hypothetical protein
MGGAASRLPDRFPVGTRYVIEGRAGRIRLRYLEFPEGRKVDLPADLAACAKARGSARRRRNRPQPGPEKIMKKFLHRDGTRSVPRD